MDAARGLWLSWEKPQPLPDLCSLLVYHGVCARPWTVQRDVTL